MKKILVLSFAFMLTGFSSKAAARLMNEYSFLQEITFELYSEDIPTYKVPEQVKSIEETLMFEVLHAVWKDKKWVAYTLNKNLLGTYKAGQPAILDNGDTKKIFFVASFPGSIGGLDLYTAEYSNGKWSKPKNLGKNINTAKNESNPGLLNEYTLTYSSGGIIKKLDLKTLKVVDLEESTADKKTEESLPINLQKNNEDLAAIGDNSTATPTGTTTNTDFGAIGDNSTAAPVQGNEGSGNGMAKDMNKQIAVQEKAKVETMAAPKSVAATVNNTSVTSAAVESTNSNVVQTYGNKTREEMLQKFPTAIQLGAFGAPKWESFSQFAKFGKVISYKNDKNINVVWITGFANHAAAEAVLPQVKSIPGFENAYITGK